LLRLQNEFYFRWQRTQRLKILWAGTTQAASIESVSLHRLAGAARGPTGSIRSNRLKASLAPPSLDQIDYSRNNP